jgi:hypothetical protein
MSAAVAGYLDAIFVSISPAWKNQRQYPQRPDAVVAHAKQVHFKFFRQVLTLLQSINFKLTCKTL